MSVFFYEGAFCYSARYKREPVLKSHQCLQSYLDVQLLLYLDIGVCFSLGMDISE